MKVPEKLILQYEYLQIPFVWAVLAGASAILMTKDIRIKMAIGSTLTGCMFGGVAAVFELHTGLVILLSIAGVWTAPITYSYISERNIFQAAREFKSALDSSADNDKGDQP